MPLVIMLYTVTLYTRHGKLAAGRVPSVGPWDSATTDPPINYSKHFPVSLRHEVDLMKPGLIVISIQLLANMSWLWTLTFYHLSGSQSALEVPRRVQAIKKVLTEYLVQYLTITAFFFASINDNTYWIKHNPLAKCDALLKL